MREKACSPDKSSRDQLAEHITTECSEKGVVELQERVKNVIRHSIKLIKNLKGREYEQ